MQRSSKSTYHHGNLAEALVEAALDMLETSGADAISLRSVAARLGVSHMAPYAHFKNKQEILQAVCTVGWRELTAAMIKAGRRMRTNRTRLVAYGRAYVAFAIERPELYRLMVSRLHWKGGEKSTEGKSETEKRLAVATKEAFDVLKKVFEDASRNADDVTRRALGAWSMVHGLATLIIEGLAEPPEDLSLDDYVKTILDDKGPVSQ